MDRLNVAGALGAKLAARIDEPEGPARGTALFAHCFTCSKDIFAARTVARELSRLGFIVVRFDFTGLGSSQGEFASTDFSSNVGDIVKVADAMREGIGAPSLLVGHSLGGAAVIKAANQISEVKAVATIGAPADAEHVIDNFAADVDHIEEHGEAKVTLSGRTFTIRKEFLDDLRQQSVVSEAAALKAALLVLHAPLDQQVGVENASRIFLAAKHPRSFVSLDDADHLLTNRRDGTYAADVISAWASRYLPASDTPMDEAVATAEGAGEGDVRASDAGGKFKTDLRVGRHQLVADEPLSVGGTDTGPTPYDYVASGLAACTLMTMRLYAERKSITFEATVDVSHSKVHADDCSDCADATPGKDGRIDRFARTIRFAPGTDPAVRDKLLSIADRCPVHLTLERGAAIVTAAQ
ncbi:MAG: alpha/beta fold hydrolase [Devosia sp.]